MKITGKELFPEDNQGQIIFQTGGVTRLSIAGDGSTSFAGSVQSITAASASLTGTIEIGGASDLVGVFGATPVGVQSTTATTGTFTAGAGTAAVSGSSWVGNTGTKSYTVSDVVSALKKYGLLGA